MKSILTSLIIIASLSGCSLYKSEGRKQFESDAPAKVQTSSKVFELKNCRQENSLESWFNEEFPRASYELVVSETDLEIWRTTHSGSVEVKAIQKTDSAATQSCFYEFSDNTTWELYKDQFIKELENNLMTQD